MNKINRDAESFIKLLSLEYRQKQIVQILNLKKQNVSYWEIKLREKKLETKEGKSWKIYIYLESLYGPRTKQQVLWVVEKLALWLIQS